MEFMNTHSALDVKSDGASTTQNVLRAAYLLFSQQGYHATSVRQIAHAADLLVSSLYNYFRGKEAIYEGVLKLYHPWLRVHVDPTAPCASDIEKWVPHFLQALAAEWVQDPDGLRLHLVEVLEFQGQHIAMLYKGFQGTIALLISHDKLNNANVNPIVEQLSESAVALFHLILLNECLQQVERKTASKKIMFDLKTMLNLWNSDVLYKILHNHLSHA
jgi:AcrR family transcriptional regulator